MSPSITERFFELRLAFPRGTVAIGGYSPVPEELDTVHARDRDGRPLVTATALRGALREALESLVRGGGGRACRGGDGVDPRDQPRFDGTDPRPEPLPPQQCTVDDGHACLSCLLFGSQHVLLAPQPDSGLPIEAHFGALVIGDALLVDARAEDEAARPWAITHGVTIDRRRRSAKEGLLVNREAPAAGRDLVFVTRGRLTDARPMYRRAFEAAVHLTRHIGSNTSRGFGRVDMSLTWHGSPPIAAPGPLLASTRDRQVVVTLERPAAIGTPINRENAKLTRVDIPGSTLRGAVGWAIAESLKASGDAPGEDTAFTALVAEREGAGGGAIFDFLHPCSDAPPDGIAGPFPMTRRQCKRHEAHAHSDVTLDRLALALARGDDVGRAVRSLEQRTRCATCDGPLTRAAGYRGLAPEDGVRTRLISRVQMDGRRRSARQGMLFGQEVMESGARFVGSIRHIPPGTAERLATGLSAPLSLGRGRSQGWGRIAIEVAELAGPAPLDARRDGFVAAFDAHVRAMQVTPAVPARRLLVLTATTPMLVTDTAEGADIALLSEALGGAEPILKVRRFGVEDGWDVRFGPRPRTRSVLAGAVYVFDAGDDWSSLRARVERIESEGIGAGRCRGFGRIVFFDPALIEPERQQMKRNPRAPDGPEARTLVNAAESVMAQAFDDRQMRGRLSKSQMSQLIGVCQEASCHEEIVNYLRYQAGRADPSWTMRLTEAVIGGMTSTFGAREVAEDDDRARVDLWRRYATYLARSFTWHEAVRREKEKR